MLQKVKIINAMNRSVQSLLLMSFSPYLRENKKIPVFAIPPIKVMSVAHPAPCWNWMKAVSHASIPHGSHENACGFV